MEGYGYILPFLWVHGEDEATYRKMVEVIYNANIRQFCVEARPHDGFCQGPWWRDMDILLDEAERRGMKVWILDDKHFPTGYAAGQVLKAPVKLRRQGLLHKVFPARGRVRLDLDRLAHPPRPKPLWYQVTDRLNHNTIPACRFDDDRWYSVTALRVDRPSSPLPLERFVKNGVLEWAPPAGEWQVHLCFLSRNTGSHRGYINMMDRESCRIQIDSVYQPHFDHYGDKFGKVIAGFFSDEPELGNNRMYQMGNVLGTEQDLPWSRELEAALKERLGPAMPSLLPLLWAQGGGPRLTAKVRYHFMDCVSRLVEWDFSQQIGRWCQDHGVEYIGHVVEDNNQHARTGTSLGHYFRGLSGQTMAGIDDIGGQVEPGCEDRRKKSVFGFTDDGEFYHYALGKLGSSLGQLNPRMQGRTLCEVFGNYGWKEGVRLEKYLLDHFMVRGVNRFVPHAFTCSPYPEKDCPPHFYAQGNNPQYRHFGALMAYAQRVCGLLSRGRQETPVAVLYHAEAEWCGKAMLTQKPARQLLDHQIDFHIVPADVFSQRELYRTQVTDKLTVNGYAHQALVIPYAQFLPREVAQGVEELLGKGGRVLFVDGLPEGLCTGEPWPDALKACPVLPLEQLAAALSGLAAVELSPACDRVRVLHSLGGREFYYLFHEGQKPYRGTVTLPPGEYHLYDPWFDRRQAVPCQDGKIPVELAPFQSLFLVKGPAPADAYCPAPRGEKTLLTHFTQSVCRAKDYPHFSRGREIGALGSYAKQDKDFSGFLRYETEFTGPAATLEITDAYEGVEVFLNGESLGIQVIPPFVYDLRGKARAGANRLAIEVATTLERENGQTKDAAPTGITGEVALYP